MADNEVNLVVNAVNNTKSTFDQLLGDFNGFKLAAAASVTAVAAFGLEAVKQFAATGEQLSGDKVSLSEASSWLPWLATVPKTTSG